MYPLQAFKLGQNGLMRVWTTHTSLTRAIDYGHKHTNLRHILRVGSLVVTNKPWKG